MSICLCYFKEWQVFFRVFKHEILFWRTVNCFRWPTCIFSIVLKKIIYISKQKHVVQGFFNRFSEKIRLLTCNTHHTNCFFLFAESTHSVDGPNLWLLNLDQDLVNTLRVNFPEWNFGSSAVVTAVTEDLNNNNTTTSTNTIIVETQRKTATRRQQQRKSSESQSSRKNYSKSSSISSNDKKMAEGKCLRLSMTAFH